jgi:hypothetical protein
MGCYVDSDGSPSCFGQQGGALPEGNINESQEPQAIEGSPELQGITNNNRMACGWTADGEGWCWGKEPADLAFRPPARVAEDVSHMVVSRIANPQSAYDVWCARLRNGTVSCGSWGDVQVPTIEGKDWVSLTAGNAHVCGTRRDETVACWGWDLQGIPDDPLQRVWTQEPIEIW